MKRETESGVMMLISEKLSLCFLSSPTTQTAVDLQVSGGAPELPVSYKLWQSNAHRKGFRYLRCATESLHKNQACHGWIQLRKSRFLWGESNNFWDRVRLTELRSNPVSPYSFSQCERLYSIWGQHRGDAP